MAFLLALVLGVVAALASGGRPSNIGRRPLRGLSVLLVAVFLQAVPGLVDVGDTAGLACVLASYALLLAFALANVRLVGMPVVVLGLLLNIAVIGANGGMPVRGEAILTVDRELTPAQLTGLDFGAKRHLEQPDDRLTFLGDVVPLQPFGQVVSFGDLILAVGLADVAFRLLRPTGRLSRRPRRTVADVLAMWPALNVPDVSRSV